MISYVLSSAAAYIRTPPGNDNDVGGHKPESDCVSMCIARVPTFPDAPAFDGISHPSSSLASSAEIKEVLASNDLYHILGISRSSKLEKLAIRRAYLSRSKACHPDKFPDNPEATHAFQKVAVAYDVLSKPSSKRIYDSRSPAAQANCFDFQSSMHAEETFKGVIVSVINDFLDGDMEMIRTLLRAINDINPSLKLGDEGINSVLAVFQTIRQRALTCRTCVMALHSELIRVLEIQTAFRQLPYLDIAGRSRLTIQLTRITLSLPVTLERAIRDQNLEQLSGKLATNHDRDYDKNALLPHRVILLIRGIDLVLDRIERILG